MAMGDEFCQLSGEDATVAAFLAQGGHGCISVTSNVAPKQCAELHTAWQKGDIELVDNHRVMHGRYPYRGNTNRQVLVCLAREAAND